MKELRSITIATAATLALVSPASANPTQVTNVRVNPNGAGFDVVLETQGGKAPQVFNVNRGNTWNAYVFNAQISQPFNQKNPAPGIAQISVIPSGANGVQVTVVGTNAAPIGQIASRNAQGVIFNVAGAGGGSAPNTAPPIVTAQAQSAPLPTAPVAQSMPNSTTPIAPFVPSAQVPNQGQPVVPVAPAPPLLRRAVAPPVGDQAISQIDTSATTIDLGTNERIPRLVLRDAPVREVLSLLARAAKLNLAYVEPPSNGQQGQQGAKPNGPTISLDIENESVQEVFNHVLRVTCVTPTFAVVNGGSTGQCASLEANRVGRTLFVGPRLPDDARNFITRTIRLNQVSASDAAGFLTTQGAETQQAGTRRTVVSLRRSDNQVREELVEEPAIISLRATEGTAPLLLRGVAITADPRLNTVTLVGSPRRIEIATRLLTQLDARRRQVAINVKIVDVNLLRTDDFNTSFSFGIGNNFFNVDRGAAVFNFGQYRPPTSAESTDSLAGRPIINNPYTDSNSFINVNGAGFPVPNTSPGERVIVDGRVLTNIPNGSATFFGRSVQTNNPLQPGITDITPATPNVTTFTTDPTTGRVTGAFSPGTVGALTAALPTLFQFPTRFLARLQSQVTSGNAKILTDPTVIVQEGQKANVNLTQDVVTNTKITRTDTAGVSRETVELERQQAGLKLDIVLDRIDDNGFVSLSINPSVTAPVSTVDTGAGRVVLLSRREIQSGLIRLRDGQTLILSGIIQESDRSSVRKVPILGDLPLLGSLFRSTSRDNQRQEVIVMLTPQILDDSDQSNFGYGYVPGREVRQFLQQQENR
ncbi:type IV pilus secretin family protein [Leptolyngbya sp. NIES-2104]|uniref:type IV pilus secretin family protein n=1 Tax=Leptolyngbya sp. NIES-2104 TaxID=1552121 RepID=UPI0006EC4520|nr:type IV pilus secretin family protein [Leptolyngbya sp. NIES-2104]GAP97534.1 type IV pilus biogenesis protein PilQ [Leptolyngbya sp. NIES-2104]